ncbi:unnamed protein product, partial [Allacma fusca]
SSSVVPVKPLVERKTRLANTVGISSYKF